MVESINMFKFAVIYLEIFFALIYLFLLIYMTNIYPKYYRLSDKVKKVCDSIITDYTLLIFILIIFSSVNIFYTGYIHIIFWIINIFILLSTGTVIAGFLSKLITEIIRISNKTKKYIVYLLLFSVFILFYIYLIFMSMFRI